MRTLDDVLVDVRRLQDEVRTIVSDAVDKPKEIIIYDGYFDVGGGVDPTGAESIVIAAESAAGQKVTLHLEPLPFLKVVLGVASDFFKEAQKLKEQAA